MALKIYVKLQTPTIELRVAAKDAAGAKDSFLVGFKRYEIEQAQVRVNVLQELLNSAQTENSLNSSVIDSFIKSEIVYIKQAKLDLDDEGNSKELTVQDTRTAKPVAGLWDTGEEALDVLTNLYLSSSPYRLALILASQKALFNSDYSEGEVKN